MQKFQSNQRLQSQGLTVRLLEEALSVRVEKLPPSVVEGKQANKHNFLICSIIRSLFPLFLQGPVGTELKKNEKHMNSSSSLDLGFFLVYATVDQTL